MRALLLACLLLLIAAPARAACTNPAYPEGKVFYNADQQTLQYCDGTNWIQMNAPGGTSGPTGCPTIGDTCSDNTIYLGQVTGIDIYAADAATDTSKPWNNGNSTGYVTTGLVAPINNTDGPGNTVTLTEHPGGGACQDGDLCDSDSSVAGAQPHQAAQYCADLNADGYSDWYLPATDELNLFWNGGTPIAGVHTTFGNYYWSSKEAPTNPQAHIEDFSNGVKGTDYKYDNVFVRCVRRNIPASGCTNPTRAEGTIIYNAYSRVPQVCSGGQWMALGPVISSDSLTTTGLVGWWKLDDGTGTTATDATGGSDGTLKGGAVWTSGRFDGAVAFNGSSQYINIPVTAALNATTDKVTVSAWFKANATGSPEKRIVSMPSSETAGSERYALTLNGNKLKFWVGKNAGDDSVATAFTDTTQWHHAVGVYDGTTMTLYLDGVEVGSKNTQYSGNIRDHTNGNLQIGRYGPDWGQYFDGKIDDVRIYYRALSASEIQPGCTTPARAEGTLLYNSSNSVMQYCDGTNWVAIGKGLNSPANCPNVGDTCSDGTIYIGQVGGNDIYATAAASETTKSWNNGNISNYVTTNLTSTTDGPGNTTGLTEHSGGGACQQGDICDSDSGTAGAQPHKAAQYCADLSAHGHGDWYLPAKDELNLFWNGGTPVAGVNTGGSSYYWSSTENDNLHAWFQTFSDGSQYNSFTKNATFLVRCVRR